MSDSMTGTATHPTGTTNDGLLLTIIDRLAAARGVDPLDLPPLHDYIDTDALDTLFRAPTGHGTAYGSITFRVERDEVVVGHDGSVSVSSLGGESDSTAYN